MGQKQPTRANPAKSPKGTATAARRRRSKPRATPAAAEPEGPRQALDRYAQAVAAVQRREFDAAAALFGQVMSDFPDARELHERSGRYLLVCERESQKAPKPKTLDERVYAATLALNAGLHDEALRLLAAAQRQSPDSDSVQYMLALARAGRGDLEAAGTHLLRAIELNPDNRYLARQEPSLEPLREDEAIQEALRTSPADRSPRGAGSHSSR